MPESTMSPRIIKATNIKFVRPRPIIIPQKEFKKGSVTFRDSERSTVVEQLSNRRHEQNDSILSNVDETKHSPKLRVGVKSGRKSSTGQVISIVDLIEQLRSDDE